MMMNPEEVTLDHYDVRVFPMDGWAWIVDLSNKTYICSARAHAWCEPLYPLVQDDQGDCYLDGPDPDYFGWHEIVALCEGRKKEDVAAYVDPEEWAEQENMKAKDELVMDAMREECNGNCRI